jgi:hypothetical protein
MTPGCYGDKHHKDTKSDDAAFGNMDSDRNLTFHPAQSSSHFAH